MAGNAPHQEIMLQTVAEALGSDLLSKVAFVGGCTTALFITDDVTRESVRFTEDVDLIMHVLGYNGWHAMLSLRYCFHPPLHVLAFEILPTTHRNSHIAPSRQHFL